MNYSQNNEAAHVRNYFNGKLNGTVLDIGANDGRTFSNSLDCIERGWNAVLVEPAPTALAALSRLHVARIANGQVQVLPYAIAHLSGTLVFHESGPHVGNGDTALLSTLSAKETDRWKASGNTFRDVEVDALTWPEALELCRWKTFELISIDAEQMDYFILQQMDLKALGCLMLIVEDNDGKEADFDELVIPQGFQKRMRTPENLIYVR